MLEIMRNTSFVVSATLINPGLWLLPFETKQKIERLIIPTICVLMCIYTKYGVRSIFYGMNRKAGQIFVRCSLSLVI